jgi:RNA polymerase sigma factor (sigma-70 family)
VTTEPTVFIVDDDEAVRQSLQMLAESVGYPTRTFAAAQDFLAAYDPGQRGCLVLDVRMRGMSGLELQEELTNHGATLPVIMVTGHGDIPMAVRAMRAGALDFIEKPYRDQVMLDRIQQAIEVNTRQHAAQEELDAIEARLVHVTPREREVLDLVVSGRTNKEIAAQLGISVRAVESHRARVMERMQADSVATLVRMVLMVRKTPQHRPDPS